LKDMIVKHKTMMGFRAPYVPGWDCHGLPIELKVTKKLGSKARSMDTIDIRNKCREYANEFVNIQREEFKRLGVFADYEHPYLTMSRDYEATIAAKFGELFEKGYIFKGKKPIYWCPSCETALAEAEVEYHNHTSDSIYVKFRIEPSTVSADGVDPQNSYVVIWTTTPWTLPANLAVCFHPDLPYSYYRFGDEYYILADGLAEQFQNETGLTPAGTTPLTRNEIQSLTVYHPFIDRESRGIFGTHVTLEAGTGIVHTAPGHGAEDYYAGVEHGMDIFCPVDHQGRYTDEYSEMKGVRIWDANAKIIDIMKENGSLISTKTIEHSYPHCWRCKKPLIFRATEQWFMGVDINDLRRKALASVDTTQWVPKWGESRIKAMVGQRPDWCLSRQRTWGVPIPSFSCTECGRNVTSAESLSYFAALAAEEGIDIWYTKELDELIPDGTKCECGSNSFVKEHDILDVWFDSGISHFAVLETRDNLRWPADLYLEGSDQHRGWFQSSLWPAMALRGRPPYETVLTHGFLLDEKGRAMSKSLGNGIEPEEIIKQYGADILRLWVSSEDYRSDLKIGNDMIKQIADSYRKIRNTFKFIIGNLADFSKENEVAYRDLSDVDKWVLFKLHELNTRTIESYEKYEFHLVYRRILNFCAVELSSVYFDISKDILYIESRESTRRRATQTVLYHLLKTMEKLIAPVLAFTAEEIWQYAGNTGSVHEQEYVTLPAEFNNTQIAESFGKIVEIKKDTLKALEKSRADKTISRSQEASLTVYSDDQDSRDLMKKLGKDLGMFFQVAAVDVADALDESLTEYESCSLSVTRFSGEKCERCWNYYAALGNDPQHPQLCERCAEVIQNMNISTGV
ncbi:MAG: isoleucine--tRNA ligase, partial [Spirochaetota bacterium]